MAHVDSHQSCCFRTEATGAKRNTLISVFQGQSHLIDREIALRSYQHGDVIVPSWAAPAESSVGHDLEISAKKSFFSISS